MCPDWESNQQPFASQVGTQSIEPHSQGRCPFLLSFPFFLSLFVIIWLFFQTHFRITFENKVKRTWSSSYANEELPWLVVLQNPKLTGEKTYTFYDINALIFTCLEGVAFRIQLQFEIRNLLWHHVWVIFSNGTTVVNVLAETEWLLKCSTGVPLLSRMPSKVPSDLVYFHSFSKYWMSSICHSLG